MQNDILSGYVKDVCWKYENEYRLRRKFDSSCTGEYIDILISENLLKELIIYPSPVSTVEDCEKLFSELEETNGKTSVSRLIYQFDSKEEYLEAIEYINQKGARWILGHQFYKEYSWNSPHQITFEERNNSYITVNNMCLKHILQ